MATDYCVNNLDMSRDTAWRGNITLVFEIWYRTRNYGYDGRYRTLLNAFVRKIELWHTCLKIGSRPKWYILNFFASWQNCEKWLLASSCLYVLTEQLGCHWTDFHEMWYTSIFRKSVENIQTSLQSDKNNGYFTWGPIHILIISLTEWNSGTTQKLCLRNG